MPCLGYASEPSMSSSCLGRCADTFPGLMLGPDLNRLSGGSAGPAPGCHSFPPSCSLCSLTLIWFLPEMHWRHRARLSALTALPWPKAEPCEERVPFPCNPCSFAGTAAMQPLIAARLAVSWGPMDCLEIMSPSAGEGRGGKVSPFKSMVEGIFTPPTLGAGQAACRDWAPLGWINPGSSEDMVLGAGSQTPPEERKAQTLFS